MHAPTLRPTKSFYFVFLPNTRRASRFEPRNAHSRIFNMPFTQALHRHLNTVDSTNDEASRWMKSDTVPEGSVVVAEFQSNGKGQRNNTWQSDSGLNLMCSLILYPKTQAESGIFYFSKAMACAVRETVAEMGCTEVTIKWPNDALIGRKKVSGMLIENQWSANGWSSAIVGIGINVNQRDFEGLAATSIAENTGTDASPQMVLSKLKFQVEHFYSLFQSEKFEDIDTHYHGHLLGLNSTEYFETENGAFVGIIRGVSADGLLQIQRESGELQAFQMKEVKLIL